MLRLLTDEHISPTVARQVAIRCRGLYIKAIQQWESGHFLGAGDEVVLKEAHRQKLTLVSYDLRTIPPVLRSWAEQGIDHSGVILVDEKTIPQSSIGDLVTSLADLAKRQHDADWTNRVIFLKQSS